MRCFDEKKIFSIKASDAQTAIDSMQLVVYKIPPAQDDKHQVSAFSRLRNIHVFVGLQRNLPFWMFHHIINYDGHCIFNTAPFGLKE